MLEQFPALPWMNGRKQFITAWPSCKHRGLELSSPLQLSTQSEKSPNWFEQALMAALPQKFLHAATALLLVAPAPPPAPVLGAPAMPDEPPAIAPPATPVFGAPAAEILEPPPLGVGGVVVVVAGEPLTPVEPPLGSELPKPGSSSGVSVEVRPPQPAIATTHKTPSETRTPENDTAIAGI